MRKNGKNFCKDKRMLQITLLGKTEISFDGECLDKQLSTKAQGLIYLLLAHKGKFLSREKIMTYLWPDSAQDAARYNLRYNLWQLKKLIPQDCDGEVLVVSEKDGCLINPKYKLTCDLIDINEYCFEETTIEKLLYIKSLFCGEVMEGWYLKGCNEFNDMILYERMRCESIQVKVLKALAQLFEENNLLEKALEVWEEMSFVEVDNEDIAYNIMRLYVKIGNRVQAINHYKKFETNLWDNMNIAPKEELQHLYRELTADTGPEISGDDAKHYKARTSLCITGYCIKHIDYFLISDIISELMRTVDKRYLKDFEKSYVLDLSVIQRDLLVCYEKITGEAIDKSLLLAYTNIPPVRIVQAFCKLIEFLSERYSIVLHIKNKESIDSVSSEIIGYLDEANIPGFQLE